MWWPFAISTNLPNVHVKSALLVQRASALNRYLDTEDIAKGFPYCFFLGMLKFGSAAIV